MHLETSANLEAISRVRRSLFVLKITDVNDKDWKFARVKAETMLVKRVTKWVTMESTMNFENLLSTECAKLSYLNKIRSENMLGM